METEMEMRAEEDIAQGEDITPPLCPLSFSLHNSFLISHCSSCFSPLPTTTTTNLFYCSLHCSSIDSARHQSSSEIHCVHSADVRAALRLLTFLQSPPTTCQRPRLSDLLTNRDKLLSSDEPDVVLKIREGAREMAKARGNLSDDIVLEEAALCLVMTNAVEVQDKSGRILGIAVYDKDFSWINHSCTPNACYRFLLSETNEMTSLQDKPKMRIVPHVKSLERVVLVAVVN